MNRKFYQKWNAFYSKVSLRYVIWGAFTLTALLGAVLMGTSFYNRFSLQLQGIVEKQNRALIEQVNNTLTSELRNIMRISDSLTFRILKSEGKMFRWKRALRFCTIRTSRLSRTLP